MLEMGYDFDLITRSLRALKEEKKYNPVGEVQRAIDWINNFLDKQEIDRVKEFQRQSLIDQALHEHQVKAVIEQSTESAFKKDNATKQVS